jgi:hypothetical protein
MLINEVYSPVSLVYSNFEDCGLFIMIMTGVAGRKGMLRFKFALTTSSAIVLEVTTRSH